jgi:DNA-binding NarL/FixJ family response regulator
MLEDIVREVLQLQPDINVVGEIPTDASLVEAVEQGQADVVIVGTDRIGFPESWLDLIDGHPNVKLIALLVHGRQGAVCWALSQSSLAELLDAVRHEVELP